MENLVQKELQNQSNSKTTIELKVTKDVEKEIIKGEYIKVGDTFYIRKDYAIKLVDDLVEQKIASGELILLTSKSE
ncbi:MAG: hypothetical protein AB7E36_14895 [Salinivirgaceae bacterium]